MEHAYIIDGRRSYIGVENGMYKHLPAEVLAAEVLVRLYRKMYVRLSMR